MRQRGALRLARNSHFESRFADACLRLGVRLNYREHCYLMASSCRNQSSFRAVPTGPKINTNKTYPAHTSDFTEPLLSNPHGAPRDGLSKLAPLGPLSSSVALGCDLIGNTRRAIVCIYRRELPCQPVKTPKVTPETPPPKHNLSNSEKTPPSLTL